MRRVPHDVIESFKQVPLFSACNRKELREITSLGSHIPVSEGEVLTRQGAPGREFFLLLSGKARCDIDGATVSVLGAGDFLGEMALLERGPRTATVTMESAGEVLVLDGREFEGLLQASPSISRKLLKAFAQRVREDEEHHK